MDIPQPDPRPLPMFADVYHAREREVSYEKKAELFGACGDILLLSDSDRSFIREARGDKRPYIDSFGLPAKKRDLFIDTKDGMWPSLEELGVSAVELVYYPERTIDDRTFTDQFNFGIFNSNGTCDLFTMLLISEDDTYRIHIGNRFEIQRRQAGWLEISKQDAHQLESLLERIKRTLKQGLAA